MFGAASESDDDHGSDTDSEEVVRDAKPKAPKRNLSSKGAKPAKKRAKPAAKAKSGSAKKAKTAVPAGETGTDAVDDAAPKTPAVDDSSSPEAVKKQAKRKKTA